MVFPNEAQSTPLSEAQLGPVYIERVDFLREQCHAASLRMGILGELIEAETTILTPLTVTSAGRRSLELESAQDEESAKYDEFHRREMRLVGELYGAGLAPWTHPRTGERGIQTRHWDVGALCADATRAKPDQHVRVRTSCSARPQD